MVTNSERKNITVRVYDRPEMESPVYEVEIGGSLFRDKNQMITTLGIRLRMMVSVGIV